jgi:hypothetical protein
MPSTCDARLMAIPADDAAGAAASALRDAMLVAAEAGRIERGWAPATDTMLAEGGLVDAVRALWLLRDSLREIESAYERLTWATGDY